MRSDHETVQPFNLETMSGVFPGTRTQIFQRLRLRSIAGDKGEMTWSQFLWFAQPPVAVLVRTIKEGTQLSDAPILELIQPLQGNFLHRLEEAARSRGWQLEICGSCDAWQSLAERNPDGVPTGLCGWRSQQDNSAATFRSILRYNPAYRWHAHIGGKDRPICPNQSAKTKRRAFLLLRQTSRCPRQQNWIENVRTFGNVCVNGWFPHLAGSPTGRTGTRDCSNVAVSARERNPVLFAKDASQT